MRRLTPDWILLESGFVREVTVTVADDGTVLELGGEPGRRVDGVMLPGLVKAHTHLELSALQGRVPAGLGLPVWVEVLMRLRSDVDETTARAAVGRAALELVETGTAAVVEVSNTGLAVQTLAAARIQGVVHAEVLGIDAGAAEVAGDHFPAPESPGLVVRPSPHAPYSTSAELIQAAVACPGPMASGWHGCSRRCAPSSVSSASRHLSCPRTRASSSSRCAAFDSRRRASPPSRWPI